MRLSAALMIVLLVLPVVGSGAAARPTAFDARQETPPTGARPTTISIHLHQNGDATWNVTTRFPLRTENETAAFRRLAADFENRELDTQFSTDVFETLADRSGQRTGRSMAITDTDYTSNVTNETGRLTLSFTWTNFSRVRNGRVLLGDVFETGSGTWLPAITEDQRLIIRPPDGYGVNTSPTGIGVNNGTIDVNGSQSFRDGLQVEYVKSQEPTETPEKDFPVDWSQFPVLVVLVMAMGVGGLGVYVWTKRQNDPAAGKPVRADGTATGESGGGREPSGTERSTTAPAAPPEDDEEVREELLSDEERVERLIADNGGRMMQANIVKETNWSNAKVSQLLSSMDDEGRINKLRIGRENLITFPDEDVTDIE